MLRSTRKEQKEEVSEEEGRREAKHSLDIL